MKKTFFLRNSVEKKPIFMCLRRILYLYSRKKLLKNQTKNVKDSLQSISKGYLSIKKVSVTDVRNLKAMVIVLLIASLFFEFLSTYNGSKILSFPKSLYILLCGISSINKLFVFWEKM